MTAAPPPELVIFCRIQATGKSTFFQRNLFHSHLRIGLDLCRTSRGRSPSACAT